MDTISLLSQARQAVLEVRGEVLIYLVYLSGKLIPPVVKKKKFPTVSETLHNAVTFCDSLLRKPPGSYDSGSVYLMILLEASLEPTAQSSTFIWSSVKG